MKILMDTHVIIWALIDSPKLSGEARALISDPKNEIYISVLSLWEIEIKRLIRPDRIPVNARLIAGYCSQAGYKLVPLKEAEIYELESVTRAGESLTHKDPFDRMLICQAAAGNMVFLTHDASLKGYGMEYIRIV